MKIFERLLDAFLNRYCPEPRRRTAKKLLRNIFSTFPRSGIAELAIIIQNVFDLKMPEASSLKKQAFELVGKLDDPTLGDVESFLVVLLSEQHSKIITRDFKQQAYKFLLSSHNFLVDCPVEHRQKILQHLSMELSLPNLSIITQDDLRMVIIFWMAVELLNKFSMAEKKTATHIQTPDDDLQCVGNILAVFHLIYKEIKDNSSLKYTFEEQQCFPLKNWVNTEFEMLTSINFNWINMYQKFIAADSQAEGPASSPATTASPVTGVSPLIPGRASPEHKPCQFYTIDLHSPQAPLQKTIAQQFIAAIKKQMTALDNEIDEINGGECPDVTGELGLKEIRLSTLQQVVGHFNKGEYSDVIALMRVGLFSPATVASAQNACAQVQDVKHVMSALSVCKPASGLK